MICKLRTSMLISWFGIANRDAQMWPCGAWIWPVGIRVSTIFPWAVDLPDFSAGVPMFASHSIARVDCNEIKEAACPANAVVRSSTDSARAGAPAHDARARVTRGGPACGREIASGNIKHNGYAHHNARARVTRLRHNEDAAQDSGCALNLRRDRWFVVVIFHGNRPAKGVIHDARRDCHTHLGGRSRLRRPGP